MTKTRSREASIPNPALLPLGALIGNWETVGTHPLIPGTTFHGRTTFEWLEGGAFMIMHSEVDEPGIPTGVAILGTDASAGQCSMLYFDERGVSRKYEFALQGNTWKWWREAPGFSQRFTVTIVDDGQRMIGKGELSKDGATWEGDLDLTFVRAESRA